MSLVRFTCFGLLLSALAGCQAPADTASRLPTFTLPQVSQRASELPAALRSDSIQAVWPRFIGRFAFANQLVLEHPQSVPEAEWLHDFAPMHAAGDSTSLNTDGLELVADYRHPLVYQKEVPAIYRDRFPAQRMYPVYLVNSTARTKLLYGKDTWVFAIQEAQDRQGRWRPIESRGFDLCGNGRWLLKLRPRQLALFLVRQYQGPFHTQLRIRLQNGESRYVSAPYPGQISERQFLAPIDQALALHQNRAAVNWLYYGAEPVVLDSIEAQEERQQ